MAFRVFIDPGHGGTDPGAVYNGRQEKDDNLNLALTVGRILEDNGIDVVYSRTEDFYDSPYEKALKGNESEADLFLSFHRNAANMPGRGTGADMLVYSDTGFASEVAGNIGKEIEKTGLPYNGITERHNLAVLRRTKMPAVLIEAGFLDNENDNQFFDENFSELAEAIARGVMESIGQDMYDMNNNPDSMDRNGMNRSDDMNYSDSMDRSNSMDRSDNMRSSRNINAATGMYPYETISYAATASNGMCQCPKLYRVQVGAFTNPMFATQLLNQLLLEGYPAFVVYSDGLYRVQVGAFNQLDNAVRMEQRLRKQGYQTYITT